MVVILLWFIRAWFIILTVVLRTQVSEFK